MKHIRQFLIALALLLVCKTAITQNVPTGFSITNIGDNWEQPVGVCFNKTGTKLFVWEKAGKVYVCNWNTTTQVYDKQTTPVLDISEEVGNWRDHGFLGFTIDPAFDVNGYIYAMYIVDRHHLVNYGTASYDPLANDYFSATIGRITRYTTTISAGELLAIPASRFILLGETITTGIPILHETHGVGTLLFAEDSTLIASCGDGSTYVTDNGNDPITYFAQALADGIIRPNENVGAFRSQMINSLSGKILRIDPATGDGIPSNPFYTNSLPRSAQSRVWALGFRNPYRFTLKPGSGSTNRTAGDIGEIYLGDVGWGTYEELNIIKKPGENCGWPMYEGITPVEGAYNDTAYVLENKDEPNPLYGVNGCTLQYLPFGYLLKQATADNNFTVYNPCDNTVPINIAVGRRTFHRVPAIDWKHTPVDSARVRIFENNELKVAQIGSPESQVIGTPFSGNSVTGGVWYTGNMFPAAYKNSYFVADFESRWIKNFRFPNSADIPSEVVDFGSDFYNIVGLVENPLDGSMIEIEILDAGYGPGSIKWIKYGGNQPPVAKITSDKIFGPSPLNVNFSASQSYDPENTALTYLWDFDDVTSGANNASTVVSPAHDFIAPSALPKQYKVKLTVTDAGGASSTDSLLISVNNTPPVVNITSPVNASLYRVGPDTLYSLTAIVTDAEHNSNELTYRWQSALRHNMHQHTEPVDTNKNTSALITRLGCNGDAYYWFIQLTVTDAAGLSTKDSVKIYPNCFGVILPLNSFTLNAEKKSNSVNRISWWTDGAKTFDRFIIEKSKDGRSFTSIGQKEAAKGAGSKQYEWLDSSNYTGTVYYRIVSIELDGKVSYSYTVKLASAVSGTNNLSIAPNPANQNTLLIGANYKVAQTIILRLTDARGAVVYNKATNANPGYNAYTINNLSTLPEGLYIVELISKEGKMMSKVVITH